MEIVEMMEIYQQATRTASELSREFIRISFFRHMKLFKLKFIENFCVFIYSNSEKWHSIGSQVYLMARAVRKLRATSQLEINWETKSRFETPLKLFNNVDFLLFNKSFYWYGFGDKLLKVPVEVRFHG